MRQPSLSAALDVLVSAARGIGYCHLADAQGRVVGIESTYDDPIGDGTRAPHDVGGGGPGCREPSTEFRL